MPILSYDYVSKIGAEPVIARRFARNGVMERAHRRSMTSLFYFQETVCVKVNYSVYQLMTKFFGVIPLISWNPV